MDFPISLQYQHPDLYGGQPQTLTLNGPLTTFVGPNGSGKTQVMRQLKDRLTANGYTGGRISRYISAGRLSYLETWRSNFDGMRGPVPDYDNASLGAKQMQQYRLNAETAFGDFHTLAVKPDLQIKVAARLSALFKRTIAIDYEVGALRVIMSRTDRYGGTYSFAREASGLLNLIAILAALYSDEYGALLIDEPEVSLHPQLQAFLLREMITVAGDPTDRRRKLIIIATHSPSMLNVRTADDLTRLVFFNDVTIAPAQLSSATGELQGAKMRSLVARLGENHKSAFFASRPLIVEGPSDMIVCGAIDQRLDLYLEAAGAQFVPVGGKREIPTFAKLMKMVGKKPTILADLDALSDSLDLVNVYANDSEAIAIFQSQGHSGPHDAAQPILSAFYQAVDQYWSEIAPYVEHHPYWANRDNDPSLETRARRRATMAVLLTSGVAVWPHFGEWDGLHHRLEALLESLARLGCFVLRRGTIECYYMASSAVTSTDKPQVAVAEADALLKQDQSLVVDGYADIVRALRYASTAPDIDEAEALSHLMLAIAAPALAKLNRDTADAELTAVAKNILGDRASLFALSNASTNTTTQIQVELKSDILDVQGLPVNLTKGCNVNEEVLRQVRRATVGQ